VRLARGQSWKEEAGVERAMPLMRRFHLLRVAIALGVATFGTKNALLFQSLAHLTQESPRNVWWNYGSSDTDQTKCCAPATVGRRKTPQLHNDEIQIGAGHHRIRAAIKAGTEYADLFAGEFDDSSMIRVYARENATQRGNSGTAFAGSVAAAIKFIAKAILTGSEVSQICETSGQKFTPASRSVGE
jgi:hypothetical protein